MKEKEESLSGKRQCKYIYGKKDWLAVNKRKKSLWEEGACAAVCVFERERGETMTNDFLVAGGWLIPGALKNKRQSWNLEKEL